MLACPSAVEQPQHQQCLVDAESSPLDGKVQQAPIPLSSRTNVRKGGNGKGSRDEQLRRSDISAVVAQPQRQQA
eukprot:CAMPEP_0169418756 /NCGR_PEP_ID=MMETSP1017-20121227/64525_1 /TAXON_ID=342587 /ORGANISM="Karlodinium micrum, Strain CCMP2283" /LENGTH=73 /DNA_ID=CAMNT_0009527191 /DNA_START=278 /DNA_END=499 /DNA_ORIENTATION=-